MSDWSNVEVELVVADYFSMLINELKGIEINKTEYRRKLLPLLSNRSEGSVEFKHQNISAILSELGIPFIRGYKPRFNYQYILRETVKRYVEGNRTLEIEFENFADVAPQPIALHPVEFGKWIVPAPERSYLSEPSVVYDKPVKINYIEREQQNRKLGFLGEELAMEYEKWLLIQEGKEALADKVEWVSKDRGDGLGFDILSRNLDGTDKYIEVKTTKLSKEAPIFFTKNEFEFSIEKEDRFYLYRVFDFGKQSRMFNVQGRYDGFCTMEAVKYKGMF